VLGKKPHESISPKEINARSFSIMNQSGVDQPLKRVARLFLCVCLAAIPAQIASSEEAVPARVRVAFISTDPSPARGGLLDLALVELSRLSDVELVERADIQSLLREQQLSAHNSQNWMQLGQLVRADMIAVLEANPEDKTVVGLVVLDARSGQCYWQDILGADTMPDRVKDVVRGVTVAVEKRKAGADKLNTLCVLGIRNAEWPRSMDAPFTAVAYLLERRLVQEPSIATLDRRRLNQVIQENALAMGTSAAAILPSLRLLELEFRLGTNEQQTRILVRITDAQSQLIAQKDVSASRKPGDMADEIQSALSSMLHIRPPESMASHEDEAHRFRQQAGMLWKREQFEEAVLAFDAAYALYPGSVSNQQEYVKALLNQGARLAWQKKDFIAALDATLRGFDAEEMLPERLNGAGTTPSDDSLNAIRNCRQGLAVGHRGWVEFEEVRQRLLQRMGMTPGGKWGVLKEDSSVTASMFGGVFKLYGDYSDELPFPVEGMLSACNTSEEYFRLLDPFLTTWLERERDPNEKHDPQMASVMHGFITPLHRSARRNGQMIPFDRDFAQGFRRVTERLQEHPRVTVKLAGMFGRILCDLEAVQMGMESLTRQELTERAQAIIQLALQNISSQPDGPADDIDACYEWAVRAANLLGPAVRQYNGKFPYEAGEAHQALFDIAQSMFSFRHLNKYVLEEVLDEEVDFQRFRKPVLQQLALAQNDQAFRRVFLRQKDLDKLLSAWPSAENSGQQAAAYDIAWFRYSTNEVKMVLGTLDRIDEDYLFIFTARPPNSMPNRGLAPYLERVDLENGGSIKIGQPEIAACWPWEHQNDRCRGLFFSDALAAPDRLWMSTSGDGLLDVSFANSGEPKRLGTGTGWPSDVIHGFTIVDDVVYAGCGAIKAEGFFIAYDMAAKTCRVLASSLRAEKENPMDHLEGGFFINKIIPDPARNRLLLVVDHGDFKPGTGVWSYGLNDGSMLQVMTMDRPAKSVRITHDGMIWISVFCENEWRPVREKGGYFAVISFDPSNDKARLRFATKKKDAGPGLPVQPDTIVASDAAQVDVLFADAWAYYFSKRYVDGNSVMQPCRIHTVTRQKEDVGDLEFTRVFVPRWAGFDWLPKSRMLLVNSGTKLTAITFKSQGEQAAPKEKP